MAGQCNAELRAIENHAGLDWSVKLSLGLNWEVGDKGVGSEARQRSGEEDGEGDEREEEVREAIRAKSVVVVMVDARCLRQSYTSSVVSGWATTQVNGCSVNSNPICRSIHLHRKVLILRGRGGSIGAGPCACLGAFVYRCPLP